MKYIPVFLAVAVFAVPAFSVEPGDTRESVLVQMGEPQCAHKMEASEWLLYPQGKVWLESNRVTRAELLSPEQFAKKQVLDERARIAEQLRREAQRLERIEKGTELRARLLKSPDLFLKPAREQLQVWQRFRRDYPEIDVSDPYLAALEAARIERENEERADRIRDLEDRVRQAELRAFDAEQKAARKRRVRYTYYEPYPVLYAPCRTSRPQRSHHDRDSGSHHGISTRNASSLSGSVSVHSGHVTMKPITFGSVRFSM